MAELQRPRMIERVRARKETHRLRGRAYRLAFAAAGFMVVGAGVVLSLPGIPGPGLLIASLGLGMLALEFAWAERLLERVLHRLERIGESAARATRRQKAVVVALVAAAAGGLAAVAVLAGAIDLPVWR